MNVGLINGLPGHPLFVHAAVVLVPLTALALLVCLLWPSAARRLSWVLPVLGLVTLVLVWLTTESGEWLEERVRETPLVKEHTEMGSNLTPWVIAVFVLTIVVWLLARVGSDWGRERGDAAGNSTAGGASAIVRRASSFPVRVAVLVLALIVAVGAVIVVYQIGESGAKAVWHGPLSTSESGGRE